VKNNNCDGSGPCDLGDVRVLPLGDSNLILCSNCFDREIKWRAERNKEIHNPFPLPSWWECKRYLVNESIPAKEVDALLESPSSIHGEHDVVIKAIEEASLGGNKLD
jgi:hypothetical protein